MFCKKHLILLVTFFAWIETAFIDTLNQFGKCSIKDNECQRNLYTRALQFVASNGIPENNISPFDPFILKNVSVSVLNLLDITMIDGVAKNMKSCVFNRINTTIESYHSTMEITCDVTIKGQYKVSSSSPLVQNILGASVRADGYTKVKIEKMHITYDFDIFLRETDGEVYIDCSYKDTHYKYDFGKITFAANNVFIGEAEISRQIVPLLNSNWEAIVTAFGKPFVDYGMDIIFVETHKFFDNTPARFYLLEDLREYLANSPKRNE